MATSHAGFTVINLTSVSTSCDSVASWAANMTSIGTQGLQPTGDAPSTAALPTTTPSLTAGRRLTRAACSNGHLVSHVQREQPSISVPNVGEYKPLYRGRRAFCTSLFKSLDVDFPYLFAGGYDLGLIGHRLVDAPPTVAGNGGKGFR